MSSINWDAVKANLAKGRRAVLDLAREAYADGISIEGDKAFAEAIEKGIYNTIAALYDANVSDNDIINLLMKHWGICREEAKDRLVYEKTIEAPCREIKSFLELQGLSKEKIHDYMIKNHVRQELRQNPEISKLWRSPAKLLKALENNQ